MLLLQAAILVRQALDGPATDLEQLTLALLTIGLGGAVAVITVAARGGRRPLPRRPGRAPATRRARQPDAHRPTERERGQDRAAVRQ